MPNSFEIIVDSNAVAKRSFVLFVVGASAFVGTVTLLTQACWRLANRVSFTSVSSDVRFSLRM
jgi:hypothetical protein